MTAKHNNPSDFSSEDNGSGSEETDKIFDFDRAFGDEDMNDEEDETASNEDSVTQDPAISELKEKHLRLLAEFDNYKKRTSKERYELLNTASKSVIQALLPVLDDFERAIKSSDSAPDDAFKEGVRIIHSRLYNIMQSQGLKAMESDGEAFDVDLHDAITEIPVDDASKKGKVIDTVEKGYLLNDKIIRHAKVVVGK